MVNLLIRLNNDQRLIFSRVNLYSNESLLQTTFFKKVIAKVHTKRYDYQIIPFLYNLFGGMLFNVEVGMLFPDNNR